MKHLPVIILLTVAALVTLVTGCDSTPGYDGRLTAADALMHDNPDSALAIVEAVSPDSLSTEGDRAYRDLLLTQARYRCYITASNDSDINRALAYYRTHSREREKLTRAYIYKGAVMEELGHPDSAMLYYKHAEANADPNDYFNLGYAKMRIAELYQSEISQDSSAIIRLQEAIKYFSEINDTNYLIVSHEMLGAIFGVKCPDSARAHLEKAIDLARQFNPSRQYTPMSKLAGIYLYCEKDYRNANKLAMAVLRNGRDACKENQFYYYVVFSYIGLGLTDSAKYILALIPKPKTKTDSMNYHQAIAQLSLLDNDFKSYGDNVSTSKEIEANIISNTKGHELNKVGFEFDLRQSLNTKQELQHRFMWMFLGFITLLFAFLSYKYYLYKKRQAELEQAKTCLEADLAQLQETFEQQNLNQVSTLVGYRLSALRELFDLIRIRVKDDSRTRRVVPLSSVLKAMSDRNEILKITPPDTFWEKLKLSVDGEYEGLASFVEQHYPCLNEKDLKMFNLFAAKVSPQIIKICMNFSSDGSVSNYKKRILQQKLGVNTTIDGFITMYLCHELP